jgi:hypothetical protein
VETIANTPKTLSREERFLRLYLAAFGGLHGQFIHSIWADLDGNAHISCDDVGEKPERSKRLAQIALNSALCAMELLDQQETISEFNQSLK